MSKKFRLFILILASLCLTGCNIVNNNSNSDNNIQIETIHVDKKPIIDNTEFDSADDAIEQTANVITLSDEVKQSEKQFINSLSVGCSYINYDETTGKTRLTLIFRNGYPGYNVKNTDYYVTSVDNKQLQCENISNKFIVNSGDKNIALQLLEITGQFAIEDIRVCVYNDIAKIKIYKEVNSDNIDYDWFNTGFATISTLNNDYDKAKLISIDNNNYIVEYTSNNINREIGYKDYGNCYVYKGRMKAYAIDSMSTLSKAKLSVGIDNVVVSPLPLVVETESSKSAEVELNKLVDANITDVKTNNYESLISYEYVVYIDNVRYEQGYNDKVIEDIVKKSEDCKMIAVGKKTVLEDGTELPNEMSLLAYFNF